MSAAAGGRKLDQTRSAVAARRARIVALCRAGLTVDRAAECVGVGRFAVIEARRLAGIARPRAPRMTAGELTRAELMLKDGASYSEVARTLGRARMTIARRFPGFGWSMAERDEYTRHLRMYEALGWGEVR